MKNLKKVLSLALAFAMVLGLCIGAMAADTPDVTTLKDWADVTHKDAAQLLNAFNIMGGDDKGFRPADNVTRAEAVKMISVALWGGEDLKDLFKDGATTFTDVSSNDWFAGYVKYAATAEIIGGRNATTFDPKGNVTGYELLKMALTALGYRQADEGLIGAGWQTRAMILAMDKKLTTGVKITDWSKPINREDSAQVIANMITAIIVKYDRDGYVIESTTAAPIPTFGEMYLGLVKTTGTLVANAYGKTAATYSVTAANATKYNSVVRYLKKDVTTTPTKNDYITVEVNTNSTLFDLGLPVTIYSAGDAKAATIASKDVVSVAISTPTELVPAADGSNYAAKADRTEFATGTETGFYDTKNYDTNADGKIDLIHTVYYSNVTPVYGVVETKNLGTIYQTTPTAAWLNTYDVKGFNVESRGFLSAGNITAAKGDVIAYVKSTNGIGTAVNVGVVLTPVAGKVTRVASTTAGNVYYIDGATGLYNRSDASDTTVAAATNTNKLGFGVSGTFYHNADGVIGYFAPTQAAEKKVALLYDAGYVDPGAGTGMGSTASPAVMSVAALLTDGTVGTYTVSGVYATAGDPTSEIKANTGANISTNILGTTGPLVGLNNLTQGQPTRNNNNYVVEYVLNDDGSMTVTSVITPTQKINSTAAAVEVKSGAGTVEVVNKTGDTTATNALIVPETVTFVQTSKYVANTSAEAWAVYTGSTASYKVNQNGVVDIYTKLYNGTSTPYVAYAIVGKDAIDTLTTKSTFYYVISNNGQVDYKYGQNIYEVVYFNADTNKVVTAQMNTKVENNTFYDTMDSNGNIVLSSKMTFTDTTKGVYATGYVTGFASNVLGLTGFTFQTPNTNLQVTTDTALKALTVDQLATKGVNSYVVTKDTKFYLIDGDKSEQITTDGVTVQGFVDPTAAFATKTDGSDDTDHVVVTITYGAVVIKNSKNLTEADKVIIFAKDQTVSQKYTTNDGKVVPTSR